MKEHSMTWNDEGAQTLTMQQRILATMQQRILALSDEQRISMLGFLYGTSLGSTEATQDYLDALAYAESTER
jgi:hypothetical protein